MKKILWSIVKFLHFLGGLPAYFWGIFINQPLFDVFKNKENDICIEQMKFVKSTNQQEKLKPKHIRPYSWNRNKYITAYKCLNCGTIGDLVNICDYEPCPECGETNIVELIAKYVNDKWEVKK